MRFSLIFCCNLIAFFLQAQKNVSLGEPFAPVKTQHFNLVQVIDARMDSAAIGVCFKGAMDRRAKVLLEEGLVSNALLPWLQKAMPHQDNLPSLLVKINRLGVWEDRGGVNEVAKISADFEFFAKNVSDWHRLGEMRYWHNRTTQLDASNFHDNNLRETMQALVQYINDSLTMNTLPESIVSEQTLQSKVALPILTDSITKVGAYKNFREFRANSPNLEATIKTTPNGQVLEIKDKKKDKFRRVKPDDKVWGFYDGTDFYINQHGIFYKLTREGNRFYFYGIDLRRKQNNAALGQAMFGIIGAIVAASNTPENHYFVDWESGSFY